jgi:hypothetical protein
MDRELLFYIGVLIAILSLKVWLAVLVEKWARRKGRTGGAWLVCAFLWLIPTVIVLALLPRKPVIKMQPSSQHQINMSVAEGI